MGVQELRFKKKERLGKGDLFMESRRRVGVNLTSFFSASPPGENKKVKEGIQEEQEFSQLRAEDPEGKESNQHNNTDEES